MSAISLLATCILSCDFLLYFLYQWTYGEKRRGLARRREHKDKLVEANSRPFLITPSGNSTQPNVRSIAPNSRSRPVQNSIFQPHHSIRKFPAR